LHDVPFVAFVYALVLTPGWHVWHVFAPFVAPLATHALPMKQKPALSAGAGQAPVAGSQEPSV
jgi:hypothetical protein